MKVTTKFNETLEKLVSCALQDGVLTDKEHTILLKRAQDEGIDVDEFEMELDNRLRQLQEEKRVNEEKTNSVDKPNSKAKMEDLISCALRDGVLTDKERTILLKRAQDAGIDADEFELMLDNRLQQRQEELKAQEVAMAVEETISHPNSILSKLEKKIEELQQDCSNRKRSNSIWRNFWEKPDANLRHDIEELIARFVIPSDVSSQELLDVILYMKARVPSFDTAILRGSSSVYFKKYKEVMQKAEYLCKDDPVFKDLIAAEEEIREAERRRLEEIRRREQMERERERERRIQQLTKRKAQEQEQIYTLGLQIEILNVRVKKWWNPFGLFSAKRALQKAEIYLADHKSTLQSIDASLQRLIKKSKQ